MGWLVLLGVIIALIIACATSGTGSKPKLKRSKITGLTREEQRKADAYVNEVLAARGETYRMKNGQVDIHRHGYH